MKHLKLIAVIGIAILTLCAVSYAANAPDMRETDPKKVDDTIGSNQTLAQKAPAIFTEQMAGVLALPAEQVIMPENIAKLVAFMRKGADGYNVVVLGDSDSQLNAIADALTKAGLPLEDYEHINLFLAVTTNPSVLTNVTTLFREAQGDFLKCKAENLATDVRKGIQGAV